MVLRALAAVGLLLTGGCLLELDQTVACGDGYIDRAAGEECEPEAGGSFRDACRTELRINRDGACSDSCEIDLSACFPLCGNGVLDGDEECDPGIPDSDPADLVEQADEGDNLGTELACSSIEAPEGAPYVGGTVGSCKSDCTLDRSPCHRCGDDQVQEDEVCDGDLVDHDRIDQLCQGRCVALDQDPRPERVRCNAGCSDSCDGYVVDDVDPDCCIPSGYPADPTIPCCTYEAEDGICPFGLGE